MKLPDRWDGYNASLFRRDLVAGLIVAIIAIPLGMAFAIASGVKPQYGIYTTIIAGFCISLFGGSRYQIGGPTGAFVPVLFAVVMQYGYENLLIAGAMAGVLLLLMGLFKLGALIRFIPHPVTVGFTAGIAVIIFTGQIANFLGLTGIQKHEDFVSNMKEILVHIGSVNVYSVATALICLASILLATKYMPKVPGSLIGLALSSLISYWLFAGEVATIGSTYGTIPSALPSLHMPELTLEKIRMLLPPAFVIALLGGIESLLSAVVADGMTGKRHNSNRELIGQGIANLVTPLFGGIPATGAIARTAANIKTGAASPLSGMVHSAVVLLILLLFAPYASHIPLAGMAPILMVVAWNMSERRKFIHVAKTKSTDSIVLTATFLLTVLTDLTTAVEIGLLLAAIFFIKRMAETLTVSKVLPDRSDKHEKVRAAAVSSSHDCPQIAIYTVEGALFFGAATGFERSLSALNSQEPLIVLLRMGKVPFMDTTGEANLAEMVKQTEKYGGIVLISGIQPQPKDVLMKTGLAARIRPDHFFERTGEAIGYALTRLNRERCAGCRHFAFRECYALSGAESASSNPAEPKESYRVGV
ncbi:SulP family inorganic anion transporter [Paenibacillus ginsengarvi]|uniref:Sulfate permease n=1 Tax=Paenibacillus ginsengarvi TaxID=400777 RepID=A0A3B0CTX8_9BACL|nr:sulfate permease [Paenibacillus ginsengarvi]RKN86834.1 sulfate permease [Paenibacillus ginsengarvi]